MCRRRGGAVIVKAQSLPLVVMQRSHSMRLSPYITYKLKKLAKHSRKICEDRRHAFVMFAKNEINLLIRKEMRQTMLSVSAKRCTVREGEDEDGSDGDGISEDSNESGASDPFGTYINRLIVLRTFVILGIRQLKRLQWQPGWKWEQGQI